MQFSISDNRSISARSFGDEVIVANFAAGVYYSLRDSAAQIWNGLMAGLPLDRVSAAVGAGTSISADVFDPAVISFVEALREEGLIVPAILEGQGWIPERTSTMLPTFERYMDMKELMLLDPVHDVGDAGWPLVDPIPQG